MIEFWHVNNYNVSILYTKEYIENGIRVMKKYLFPSLEHQNCKDYIWMLNVGNKANITYIKLLLNFKRNFKSIIIYNKDHRNFIKNISKGVDVLITTRIDYDDIIYYNAVNDVRRAVNISKPLFLYGYNRGYIYYEDLDFYSKFFYKCKNGTMSVFASLIIFMKKVNDLYTIYNLGNHDYIKKVLLSNYKSYGLKKLDYNISIFEEDSPKFVYVRQRYSGNLKNKNKSIVKALYFDLNKFYGLKK